MTKTINKKLIGYLWLAILAMVLLAYLIFPKTFNITNLIALIRDHYWLAVCTLFVILCLRGLLFIAPLSITLASGVFFSPLTALLVNSFGILVSVVLIYRFSQFLGFDDYFEKRYQKQITKIKAGLDKKEIPIIVAWSFLPIFPTDLIVYVSASIKLPIWKCLLGVFIGTALINSIFIYSLNFFLPVGTINNQMVGTAASSTISSTSLVVDKAVSTSPLANRVIPPALKIVQLSPPLSEARQRVNKKPFGIKISPTNSPIKPEKFSGYHTGVDFEILPGEENIDVPVVAVCVGPLVLKKYATGYGGVAVQKCELDKQTVTIIYGHLKLSSISAAAGDNLKAGETLGLLGRGYSTETDGERKHLHLGIHKGLSVNLLGYVSDSSALSNWLNVLDYLP